MKYQARAEIRKGRRNRLAYPGCTVTAPPCQPGNAHLTVQPGGKSNTGIKMGENTQKWGWNRRGRKNTVSKKITWCLAIHAFWWQAVNECPRHRAAQGTAPSWGGRSLAAKAKMLLPSSQVCTWDWQRFPGGTGTETTLIVCNNCAHREMLTLSHTDGSRCQAQPPYGREINCQPVLNSHSPLLAKQGAHGHSRALLSLPSSSFVIYPAQVLTNEIFSTWGLTLPCSSNNGFVLLPLISIAIPCPLTPEVHTSR